ncbi:MAG: toll/interleukin-1 receptor domain-containing protein, partial [Planctomycetaceae bacterium]
MPHDVFLSYSSPDKAVADAACAALEARGIRCWIAPRDVLAGTSWSGAIVDAIAASRAMVLIFSSGANSSEQIKREVERAVHRGVPIIPFRIEAITPSADLEYFISVPHWLDALTPPLERHLDSLAETVGQLLVARPAEAGSTTRARSRTPGPVGQSPSGSRLTAVPKGSRRWWMIGAGLALCGISTAGFLGWPSPTSPAGDPERESHEGNEEDGHSAAAPAVESPVESAVQTGAPASAAQVVNLLELIDVEQHSVRGKWNMIDKSLVARVARGQAKARGFELAIPWAPPDEYRLRIV